MEKNQEINISMNGNSNPNLLNNGVNNPNSNYSRLNNLMNTNILPIFTDTSKAMII